LRAARSVAPADVFAESKSAITWFEANNNIQPESSEVCGSCRLSLSIYTFPR
jgi:hypothetical protein